MSSQAAPGPRPARLGMLIRREQQLNLPWPQGRPGPRVAKSWPVVLLHGPCRSLTLAQVRFRTGLWGGGDSFRLFGGCNSLKSI